MVSTHLKNISQNNKKSLKPPPRYLKWYYNSYLKKNNGKKKQQGPIKSEMINLSRPIQRGWPLRAWHLSSRPRDPRYVDPRWDHPNKNNRFCDSMDTKTSKHPQRKLRKIIPSNSLVGEILGKTASTIFSLSLSFFGVGFRGRFFRVLLRIVSPENFGNSFT